MSPRTNLGHWVRSAVTAVRAAVPILFSTDTNPVPRHWDHVTKIDPEPDKRLPLLYPLYLQHTDAVSVGGSSNVTAANSEATFTLLEFVEPVVFHEPSKARHVTDETRSKAAFLAIPEVLNGDVEALVGTLGEGITYLNDEMIPSILENKLPAWIKASSSDKLVDFITSWLLSSAVFEAYIIQNPESAAARRGGVSSENVLDAEKARERAMVADRHLKSEVVYIEYSGTYGGEEATAVIKSTVDDLNRSRLWYGGGIDDRDKTEDILAAGADTVVVGDIFHQIAAEEFRFYKRARDQFESIPDPETLESWIEREYDVGKTNAAAYLQTIPRIKNPNEAARQYLMISLSLYLELYSDIDSFNRSGRPTTGNLQLLEELVPNWDTHVEDALSQGNITPNEYLSEIVLPSIAETVSADFPIGHVGQNGDNDES